MLTALAILSTIWSTLKLIGFFIYDHWKVTVPVILITVIVGYLLFSGSCRRKPAKLNEPEIHAAQKAIADEDREVMVNILAESEAREVEIISNVADAEKLKAKAVEDAKKKWANADNQAMADELNRRANQ